MQAAQRTVDAYYQSREWSRANVIVVVVLYIALVILFAHATGCTL